MYQGAEIADCLEVFGGIQLSIITAEYGLEGKTPVFQPKSFPVDMKERLGSYMLIGSFDPVACDVVGARIISWGSRNHSMARNTGTPLLLHERFRCNGSCSNRGMRIKGNPSTSIFSRYTKRYVPKITMGYCMVV